MVEINISRENIEGRHGRYVARIVGLEGEAELTFTQRRHGLISADHTGAPETMRGTGTAAALVAYMVENARRESFKIVPLCPYVRAQYRRNPDWSDVMTLAPGDDLGTSGEGCRS